MTDQYNVAVVGATGLVGKKMLKVLEERRFPVKRLIPVASDSSAGKVVSFNGETLTVQPLSAGVFEGVDLALFSAGASVSEQFAPVAVKYGAAVIDNSSAWRMDPNVPLVVPEVNREALSGHSGIIANPNCSTIQLVVTVYPLHLRFKIRRIVVSTYQAVTGSGQLAVQQLTNEIEGKTAEAKAYPHTIAYNCLPHIDEFAADGYTKEEHKMINETRKIIGDPTIQISPTCVRVPVLGGHSEAVNIQFEQPFDIREIRSILADAPGVVIDDSPEDNRYPMPLNAADRDEVFVGRIRRDPSAENCINLWIVSDNLRKGAATNAVQIAERLVAMEALKVNA